MAKGVVTTIYIEKAVSPDIIANINQLAGDHKDPDEQTPNPHKIARKLLREASNAWLNFPELYEQLMANIARMQEKVKAKTA